jgi:pyruvate/2-oxoglutarate dehydrogenase complex dihydrolipoamide acyltransferase (E2) component
MSQPAGINVPLSPARRFICDLLHFARQIPTVPVQRRMNLAAVVAARAAAAPKPSWCAIFTKAYAFTCAAWPELRRAYLTFPRPHLHEHPISNATIAVERRLGDEDAVFFGHVREPEKLALAEIDAHLRRFKEQPLETMSAFRRVLRLSRLPRPLRRLLWWAGLNVSGRKRAHYLGTFAVSVYSGLGAASLHPLSVLTSTLNYGVVEPDGSVDVRLVYDHRVLDGATVARALADLERILNHEILAELRYLRSTDAA